jgi:hypothetical protein
MANNNFHHWFFRGAWRFFGSAALALALGYIVNYFRDTSVENAFGNISLAQFFFIFISILFFGRIKSPSISDEAPANSNEEKNRETFVDLGYDKDSWDAAKRRADKSLSQFRLAWLITLACWALLYLVFYFQYLQNLQPSPSFKLGFTLCADLLNVGSHTALLACYFVLAEETTETKNSPFGWLFLVVLIGIIELLLVLGFYYATPPAATAEQFELARQLLIASFGAIVGIIGGIVFGLFVGQLDSKHLDAPVWLLAMLFGYAAIQPLYPILQGVFSALAPTNKSSVLSKILHDSDSSNLIDSFALSKIVNDLFPAILVGIAGALKILLFLFIYHVFTSGRLQFYFVETRNINASIDDKWRIFDRLLKPQTAKDVLTVKAIGEAKSELREIAESMRDNTFNGDPPRFTREELHERR